MRGVSKQNVIKRARLKLIKITMFQNKAFTSKEPEPRDRRLSTKLKLKGGQKQNRVQEDPIRNIASGANSIGPKAPMSPMLIVAGEVEVAEGCTHLGHHFLELLLLVPEAVLLLALAFVTGVVSVVVVVLVGGVELLPLRVVGDEVGGVAALEAAPRRPPHLLVEYVQRAELHEILIC
jgi:hypothetical protein